MTARDVLVLHRLEFPFPVNYLCYAVWGACYAVSDARQMVQAPVLLAIMANLVLLVAGLSLNVAVDIPTDERNRDKSYLAGAALRFGRERLIGWSTAEMSVGLALAASISWWTGRPLPVLAAAGIIALHLSYNLEPVRLKRRGHSGPVAIGLSAVAGPFLLSYGTVRADFAAAVGPIFVGLGVLATGRTLWWSVPDVAGDTATGMITPTVRFGAAHALTGSYVIIVTGLGLLGWGLWLRGGLVPALLAVAASGAFLLGELAVPRHGVRSSVRMRKHSMGSVAIGNVLVALIPLVAR
jgi:lycopene elongase/hydratase (dihydrobisanhydrobacterioruberin-forming)